MVISFPCNDEAGKVILPQEHPPFCSQSILLRITSTSSLVLRRGDIEAITQRKLDATGVVVLHLANHKAIAVEGEAVDAAIEEVVACQLNIEPTPEEVLTDAEGEYRVSAVEPGILLIAVGMHAKVSLYQPVMGQCDDIA